MSRTRRPPNLDSAIAVVEQRLEQRRQASNRHLAAAAARVEALATSPVILLVAAGSGFLVGRLHVFRAPPAAAAADNGAGWRALSTLLAVRDAVLRWVTFLLPVARWLQDAATAAPGSSGAPPATAASSSTSDRGPTMTYAIALGLLLLWLVGMASGTTFGGLLHLLLGLAILAFLLRAISGRRVF